MNVLRIIPNKNYRKTGNVLYKLVRYSSDPIKTQPDVAPVQESPFSVPSSTTTGKDISHLYLTYNAKKLN